MDTQYVYVVHHETYDDYTHRGYDLYMSLDPIRARKWMRDMELLDIEWLPEDDMYFTPLGKYGYEKWYVDKRPLDEEL